MSFEFRHHDDPAFYNGSKWVRVDGKASEVVTVVVVQPFMRTYGGPPRGPRDWYVTHIREGDRFLTEMDMAIYDFQVCYQPLSTAEGTC